MTVHQNERRIVSMTTAFDPSVIMSGDGWVRLVGKPQEARTPRGNPTGETMVVATWEPVWAFVLEMVTYQWSDGKTDTEFRYQAFVPWPDDGSMSKGASEEHDTIATLHWSKVEAYVEENHVVVEDMASLVTYLDSFKAMSLEVE